MRKKSLHLNLMRAPIVDPDELGYVPFLGYPLIHRIHKEKEKKEQKKKEKRLRLLLLSLTKRGHFYIAQKGTFLYCVDTSV